MNVVSGIKSLSNKPLLITARDSVAYIVITLIVTLLFTWFYYKFIDRVNEPEWAKLALKTTATTFALAYIYEYSGANNMLAESSMRYAKGTTLSKYTSRREAMLYECLYKLLNSKYATDNENTIKHNFQVLNWLVTETYARGKLADSADDGSKLRKMVDKLSVDSKNSDIIKEVGSLDISIVKNIDYIGDRMSEELAYYLLLNGLSSYDETSESKGESIANELSFN